MKTARSYRIDTVPIPPPDWAALYGHRQIQLRCSIRSVLKSRPQWRFTALEIALQCPWFEHMEIREALDALVEDGVLVARGGEYRARRREA